MELEIYYRMFADLWKLFRQHAGIRNRQDDLQRLLADVDTFDRRYHCKLASGMAGEIMLELERLMKSRGGD